MVKLVAPVLLKLFCVILGLGSILTVNIDKNQTIGDLKLVIAKDRNYTPAHTLQLFVTNVKQDVDDPMGEDTWLNSKSPLARQIRRGKLPQEVKDLYMKEELDGTDRISTVFPSETPGAERIHLLLQIPKIPSPDGSALPRLTRPEVDVAWCEVLLTFFESEMLEKDAIVSTPHVLTEKC